MTERYEAFLAGERTDDVALYLTEEVVSNVQSLAERDEAFAVAGGVVLVVEGERGRNVFDRFTGMDAMAFAREAMEATGQVDADLAGGTCPYARDGEAGHDVRFVFAFAEEQNESAGGLYAEGDVIHAYAYCTCGESYAERWVCGESRGPQRSGGP